MNNAREIVAVACPVSDSKPVLQIKSTTKAADVVIARSANGIILGLSWSLRISPYPNLIDDSGGEEGPINRRMVEVSSCCELGGPRKEKTRETNGINTVQIDPCLRQGRISSI